MIFFNICNVERLARKQNQRSAPLCDETLDTPVILRCPRAHCLFFSTDAEPEALADYVIALLKHDKPVAELKRSCLGELEDFLEGGAKGFVDALFSYMQPDPPQQQQPERPTSARQHDLSEQPRHSRRRRSASPSGAERRRSISPSESRRDDRHRKRRYEDEERSSRHANRDHDDYDKRSRRYDDRRSNNFHGENRDGSGGYHTSRFSRDGHDTRHGRRGRGGHEEPRHQREKFRPFEPKLEVTNVPEEACTEEAISGYFSRFGTIVNATVYPIHGKVLLEYETMEQARAAISSPEAPFNNRFVRILWYRDPNSQPPEHHQQNLSQTEQAQPFAPPPAYVPRPEPTPEDLAKIEEARLQREELRAQMEELKRQQDEERRRLLANLEHLNEEDRQEILASLSQVTSVLSAKQRKAAMPAAAPTPAPAPAAVPANQPPTEVDLINRMNEVTESGAQGNEALQAQLEVLKAQHSAMGLPATSAAPVRGGLRGRGRGRGAFGSFRGRGGGAPKTYSLDLRPRRFTVTGFSAGHIPFLRAHFEQFGQVDRYMLLQNDSVLDLAYQQRWMAEQASKKGTTMEDGTQLHMVWNANPVPAEHQLTINLGGSSPERDDKEDGTEQNWQQ